MYRVCDSFTKEKNIVCIAILREQFINGGFLLIPKSLVIHNTVLSIFNVHVMKQNLMNISDPRFL